jgi:hypothetical protein
MISNYKCTFSSWEGKSTSVTQKPMPNQREQYGDTVHLFIGMGRSPRKITLMPFTFINNSMIILRGLIWFFIFKSVSFFAAILKLFYTQLRLCANLRVLCASSYRGSDPSPKNLLMYFTPETLLNHVFEDLRKPKAPTLGASSPFTFSGISVYFSL